MATVGAVGKVSSRAAQAQAPASAFAAAGTTTHQHASSSSMNATDASERVISSQCATAKSGSQHANVRGRGRRGRDFRQVKASKEPWSTTLVIDQVPVRMESDTSSGRSLISEDIWKQSFPMAQEETEGDTCQSHVLCLGTCLVEVQH